MNAVIKRVWRQDKMVNVDVLNGFVFTGEANAHQFVISGKNGDEPVDITGSITANFKNANGVLVPLTGSIVDGEAVITLTPDCYAVEGPFTLTIFADTLCIYAAIANVINSSGEVIAYPTASIPSIQELIEEAQDVIASIPQDYSALNQSVTDLKSAFINSDDGKMPIWTDDFEIGNISISGSGWRYSGNTKRVRTKEGTTIRLHPGDKISLSSYTNARMYIGWLRLDGVYNTSGAWLTADFTVYDAGDYVILLSNLTEVVQSNVTELLSLLSITVNTVNKPTVFDTMAFRVINHQGYNPTAPNNTLPAFVMSKVMGYNIVEADLRFTSDNVPVLSHDDDISSRSDGTGNISEMTYAQLSEFDFGSWKNAIYAGTKIPTLDEFLDLCKLQNLSAYIDVKACNITQAEIIAESVKKYGMERHLTFLGDWALVKYIVAKLPLCRIGLMVDSSTDVSTITNSYNSLLSGANDVFIDAQYGVYTRPAVFNAISAIGCPVEVWSLDSFDYFTTQDVAKNVTGVTTNSLLFEQVALDDATASFDADHYKIPTIKAFTDLLDSMT